MGLLASGMHLDSMVLPTRMHRAVSAIPGKDLHVARMSQPDGCLRLWKARGASVMSSLHRTLPDAPEHCWNLPRLSIGLSCAIAMMSLANPRQGGMLRLDSGAELACVAYSGPAGATLGCA